MSKRLTPARFHALSTATAPSLVAIEKAAIAAGLETSLIELVKLRASQINGCAYCVHMHATDARKLGESEERLHLLAVWQEAPCFTPRERAALAWTEALTRLPSGPVDDAVYAAVSAAFDDNGLAQLTAVVAMINAWNRIGVGFHFTPAVARPAAVEAVAS